MSTRPTTNGVYASVDGTDCRIYELTPFSKKLFSIRFNGPGLRCEIGLCIDHGEIICVHGPFAVGTYPDNNFLRN